MDMSINLFTGINYGVAAGIATMTAANAVLVGAGAGAKVGAYVADYFKNESVAQNLRIKGDRWISLAGKYAVTEFKLAAALVGVGSVAILVQYSMDNNEISSDKNDDISNAGKLYEKLGMEFDQEVGFTKYEKEVALKKVQAEKIAKQIREQAPTYTYYKRARTHEFIGREGIPDVVVKENEGEASDNHPRMYCFDSIMYCFPAAFLEGLAIMIGFQVFVLANLLRPMCKSSAKPT